MAITAVYAAGTLVQTSSISGATYIAPVLVQAPATSTDISLTGHSLAATKGSIVGTLDTQVFGVSPVVSVQGSYQVIEIALIGHGILLEQDSVLGNAVYTLTGGPLSAVHGALIPSLSASTTGFEVSSSLHTVGLSFLSDLYTLVLTALHGGIIPSSSLPIVGQSTSAIVNDVTNTSTAAISGLETTTSDGTTLSSGSYTIDGHSLLAEQSTISTSVDKSAQLYGQATVVSQEPIAPAVSTLLSIAGISILRGDTAISQGGSASLLGHGLSTQNGYLIGHEGVSLVGQSLPTTLGDLYTSQSIVGNSVTAGQSNGVAELKVALSGVHLYTSLGLVEVTIEAVATTQTVSVDTGYPYASLGITATPCLASLAQGVVLAPGGTSVEVSGNSVYSSLGSLLGSISSAVSVDPVSISMGSVLIDTSYTVNLTGLQLLTSITSPAISISVETEGSGISLSHGNISTLHNSSITAVQAGIYTNGLPVAYSQIQLTPQSLSVISDEISPSSSGLVVLLGVSATIYNHSIVAYSLDNYDYTNSALKFNRDSVVSSVSTDSSTIVSSTTTGVSAQTTSISVPLYANTTIL